MSEVLHTDNLSIGYRISRKLKKVLLSGIDLSLNKGEMVCLLGPNGVGKSTLMRTIVGLQEPMKGMVALSGKQIDSLSAADVSKQVAAVLTDKVDAGALSVYALVALGRHPYTGLLGKLTEDDERMVEKALKMCGLENMAERNVSTLSDGERQKVMIARALAQDTPIILLDEPTAFLDLPNRVDIIKLLHELTQTTGKAVLLSTHDLDLALQTADKLWLMGKGNPVITGVPEDLILDGGFEKVFPDKGFHFDKQTGSFSIKHLSGIVSIQLKGEGPKRLWLEKALIRKGYDISNRQEPLFVTITEKGYTLTHAGTPHEYTSIGEVLGHLAQLG